MTENMEPLLVALRLEARAAHALDFLLCSRSAWVDTSGKSETSLFEYKGPKELLIKTNFECELSRLNTLICL